MAYSIELNYDDHSEERHNYRTLEEAHKVALSFIKELGLRYPEAYVLIHDADRECVEHLSYSGENYDLCVYNPQEVRL